MTHGRDDVVFKDRDHAAEMIFGRFAEVIDEGFSQLAARYADRIHCNAGCSSCCIDDIRISRMEGISVAAGLRKLAGSMRERVRNNVSADTGGRCPLLVDGLCAIYRDRPIICRVFGVVLIDEGERALRCELNFRDLDAEGRSAAADVVSIDYADLRNQATDLNNAIFGSADYERKTIRETATSFFADERNRDAGAA